MESKIAPGWAGTLLFGGGLVMALALVLFVACANVAQMRLAQAETRKREFGVRLAVGASAGRVARQLLVETALLAAMGAGLGVLLAQFLMEKAAQFLSAGEAYVDYGIRLDARVLGFTLLAVALSVLFAGLAPARHAVRLNVAEVLKSEQGSTGAGSGWWKNVLAIGQVAVSIALFGTAAMFLASLRNAAAVHPGLDPGKNLYVMTVGRGLRMKSSDWCAQVAERLASIGGVRGATYARRLPLSGSGGGLTARVEIAGQAPLGVAVNSVGGDYFKLLGTRMVAGRGVEPGDRAGAALVAVISQTLAARAFPGRNPVGEWLRIDDKLRQVVGVAEDGPSNDLHEAPSPFVWLPFAQAPSGDVTLMVATVGEPGKLGKAIRAELKSFDPQVQIYSTGTLRQADGRGSVDRPHDGERDRRPGNFRRALDGGRALRRAAVHRQPQDARVRPAHGAGRGCRRNPEAGARRVAAHGDVGRAVRRAAIGRCGMDGTLVAVGNYAAESAGVRGERGGGAGADGGGSVAAGGARHPGRPDGGAARGLKTT